MLKRIYHIIIKDLRVDQREKYSFLASLLYLTTITFVLFKVFGNLEGPTRMGIYWVILLFISINIVSSSFGYNTAKRKLSHYQLYDPVELLIAKLVLSFGKLLIAAAVMMLLFLFFSSVPLKDPWLFSQVLVLGCLGMVAALTLISSITIYTQNQTALMTVLALPLLIPILMIGMRVSLISERMFFDTAVDSNLLMLLGIDLIMVVMGLIFINFTWKP